MQKKITTFKIDARGHTLHLVEWLNLSEICFADGKNLHVYDLLEQRLLKIFKGHDENICTFYVAAEDQTILTGKYQGCNTKG